MTGASQQAVQGAAASDPEGKLLLLLFSCSEGLAASRPFPIVRSGSHSFCHLESPPDLRGPSGCGGGCPSKTQLWDGESLTVLPSPDLTFINSRCDTSLSVSGRAWGQRPFEP